MDLEARRLYVPRPTSVVVDDAGAPRAVEAVAVEAVREEWVVEDRWWSRQPLRRRYYEVALSGGRAAVVFRDLREGRWYRQRA